MSGARISRQSASRGSTSRAADLGAGAGERYCDQGANVDVVFRFARDSPLEGDGFEPSVPRTSLTPNLLPEAPATILSHLDEHQVPAMKSEPGPTISLGCAASA